MQFPRRLYKNMVGEYCDESDETVAILVGGQGMEMADAEADRLGITQYFVEHPNPPAPEGAEMKEVTQAESGAEDKAESGPESPATGLQVDPEMRRRGRGA